MKNVNALFNNVIVQVIDNKYRKSKTDSGLILNSGLAMTQETGQMESVLEERIILATIVSAGPECKYVREGDEVYINKLSITPVPFAGKGYFTINELGIICKVD